MDIFEKESKKEKMYVYDVKSADRNKVRGSGFDGYDSASLALIYDYDRVLIGKDHNVKSDHWAAATLLQREVLALNLIRYVSEHYLRWSPQKLEQSLSHEVLKKWHLDGYYKFIRFPRELNPDEDFYWVAHRIYPNINKLTNQAIYLNVYRKVLSGELKKFPKNYFSEANGMNKMCVCLKYLIEHKTSFNSVEALYDFFGTEACKKFLRDNTLTSHMKALFDSSVTAFHMLLSPEQENEFLFQFYRFESIFAEQRRLETEKRGIQPIYKHSEISKRIDDKFIQPIFSPEDVGKGGNLS